MNRSTLKTWIRAAIGVAVLAVLVAWAWGLIMMPPAPLEPRYTGTIVSAASDRVLRASCFDCHSNETRYVWFNYLPVAATLVTRDVLQGRKELNFSEWDRMNARRLAKKLKETREQIESGEMPPWYFTLIRRDAVLTAEGQRQVLADLAAVSGGAAAGGEKEEREHEGKEGKKEKKR